MMECVAILFLSIIPSFHLSAQGVLNQFSYDNLRFSGLQFDAGLLGASDLTGATVAGLRVDYGRIAPRVRLLLGLSYFHSQFDQQARERGRARSRVFEDVLLESRALAAAGHKEIILTGINIGTYANENKTLLDVITPVRSTPVG